MLPRQQVGGLERVEHVAELLFLFASVGFGWTAAGEEGALACSATVLLDGDWCYSVSIQCRAEKEKDYQKVFSALLSSVELQEI